MHQDYRMRTIQSGRAAAREPAAAARHPKSVILHLEDLCIFLDFGCFTGRFIPCLRFIGHDCASFHPGKHVFSNLGPNVALTMRRSAVRCAPEVFSGSFVVFWAWKHEGNKSQNNISKKRQSESNHQSIEKKFEKMSKQ